MSQQPAASGPEAVSTAEAHVYIQPESARPSTNAPAFKAEEGPPSGAHHTSRLPPLLPQPPSSKQGPEGLSVPRQRPSRALDVHTILNPTRETSDEPYGRRRSAAHLDSPPPAKHHQYGPPSRPHSPYQRPLEPQGTSDMAGPPPPRSVSQASRRILTPKSPAYRMSSLGRVASGGGGSFSPLQSPLGPAPGRAQLSSNPAPSTMAVPPIPPGFRHPSSPYTSVQAAPVPPRRASSSALPGATSESVSPSVSYSSFSQQSQTSPAPKYGPMASQPQSRSYNASPYDASGNPPVHLQGYGLPSSTTAQSNYQMMTLNTDQGPMQIPVDVQAASKMADDKRKRNAGASARFRQRRKEKEREASSTISKLEQEARDLTEERDHYQLERDHFRRIVVEKLGPAFLDPRPPSPRQLRVHRASGGATPLGRAQSSSYLQQSQSPLEQQQQQPQSFGVERGPQGGRAVSAYVPDSALAPITRNGTAAGHASIAYSTAPPHQQHPQHPQQAYPHPHQPPHLPSAAGSRNVPGGIGGGGTAQTVREVQQQHHQQVQQQQQHQQQQVQQVQQQQPPPQRDTYDPYAPERYNRGWPSDREGR